MLGGRIGAILDLLLEKQIHLFCDGNYFLGITLVRGLFAERPEPVIVWVFHRVKISLKVVSRLSASVHSRHQFRDAVLGHYRYKGGFLLNVAGLRGSDSCRVFTLLAMMQRGQFPNWSELTSLIFLFPLRYLWPSKGGIYGWSPLLSFSLCNLR